MASTLPPPPTLAPAPALAAAPAAVQPWRRGFLSHVLVALLIGIPLAYGALRAFPLYDDGWLMLMARESGTATLSQTSPDRPLFGYALRAASELVQATSSGFVLISALLWLVFSVQAGILWKRLFPHLANYAPLVTCLSLAPIVVQAQMCTLSVALPCVLPSVLAQGALLLWLRFLDRDGNYGRWEPICAVALTVAGVLLSEYAVAASLAGMVVLAGWARERGDRAERKRGLTVLTLAASVTAVSYFVYLRLSNLAYRPDVNPVWVAEHAKSSLSALALNLITGVWYSVIGGYGAAVQALALYRDSPSTILGVLYGLLLAATLVLACRNRRDGEPSRTDVNTSQRIAVLVVAVAAALAPVVLMGRRATLTGFGSRFLIPAMPLAAVLTVLLAVTLVRKRMIWVPVALLGLASGNAAIVAANSAIHDRVLAASIGTALRPYVSVEGNYTVAIVSINGMDYELSARATADWPLDLEKKLWIYDKDAGTAAFGARTNCKGAQLHKSLRLLERNGPIDRLLWVEVRDAKIVSIDRYCNNAAVLR